MKTIVLVALLAAAGCSKKGSDCEAAMAKGTESMFETIKSRAAANPQRMESLTEMVGKMRTTLTQRCNEDKWSAETVDCFTKVTSQPEMQACEQKLGTEQRTKLRTELRQIMSSMRMTPGAGHPPTLGGSGAPPAPPGAATPPPGAAAPPAAGTTPPASPPAGATPPAQPATPPSGAAPAAGSSANGW
jgi:hypothetical protein